MRQQGGCGGGRLAEAGVRERRRQAAASLVALAQPHLVERGHGAAVAPALHIVHELQHVVRIGEKAACVCVCVAGWIGGVGVGGRTISKLLLALATAAAARAAGPGRWLALSPLSPW